MREKLYTLRWR